MFGKIASDALGLSDIGAVIGPADYNKVEADDYILHEDGEKIFFLIKSKSDEYCFTNLALLHLDGASAASKKRMLRRFAWATHPVSHVMLETAGNIDMDVEIKFRMGEHNYSIDIHKKHLTEVKDLYKALYAIAETTRLNKIWLQHAHSSLNVASATLGRAPAGAGNIVESFRELNLAAFEWLTGAEDRYTVRDFSSVFERYIHN
jgi:hypothetical protein